MTNRSRIARGRRRYTGESKAVARRGVGRGNTHGLDTCSAAQLELRALLFYFAFIEGSWRLSRIFSYSWDARPQYDDFVMANANAPDNLACTLGSKRAGRPGLPGLRLTPSVSPDRYDFVHLPTGARLSVPTGYGEGWYRDIAETSMAQLNADELTALSAAAAMNQDTKQLFAALLARSSCAAPDGQWEVGQFLFASDRNFDGRSGLGRLRDFELTGSGSEWRLSWCLPVAPETIARPLVTPGIALSTVRVVVERAETALTIRYRTTTLHLQRG